MKKQGISLIVLIITIIVILILAAAIILSIMKANPIKNAKKAVSENDLKVAQEAVTIWISNRWIDEENIGEEVGAAYSGTITKNTSNVEVNKDGNIITIKATLEDLGLEMLEEVVIEKSQVKQIKKNGSTYIDEDDKTTGNIENSENTVDKIQYTELLSKLEVLENNVNSLKKEMKTTQENMEAIQKSAITKDILFEGDANTEGSTYAIKDLSNYKYLVVYADIISSGVGRNATVTETISVDSIDFNYEHQFAISFHHSQSNFFSIVFYFINKESFCTSVISNSYYQSPRIYKIEGIK